jgi:hypothetical protein
MPIFRKRIANEEGMARAMAKMGYRIERMGGQKARRELLDATREFSPEGDPRPSPKCFLPKDRGIKIGDVLS